MRRRFKYELGVAAGLLIFGGPAVWANPGPEVTNVTASQRTDGSKLVDIGYDLADAGGEWTQVASTGPGVRSHHSMAYDSARSVAVTFGGWGDGGLQGSTWEWDGTTWAYRTTSGPNARAGVSMAYDSARGVTVLFGGHGGIDRFRDETWEWNGSTWTYRTDTGPAARAYAGMAYDSARGVTVLFGGHENGNPFPDTWEWDGVAWTLRSNTGPSARYHHAMVFDSARSVTVLFGGYSPSYYGDTWEWDGNVWTHRTDIGPTPSSGYAMAYDAGQGVTVLFGGGYSDTWEWDGSTWICETTVGPCARSLAVMAYDSARGVTVLFGGNEGGGTGNRFGDTWEYYSAGPGAPVANAGGPYAGVVGQPILFDATASYDPDGTIEGYRWDWTNDGSWDTEWLTTPTTTQAYDTPCDGKSALR